MYRLVFAVGHFLFHPVQGPGKVHCRRAGRIQILFLLFEFTVKGFIIGSLNLLCQKINSKSRRHTDGRGPSYLKEVNSVPHLLSRFQPYDLCLAGKLCLIDNDKGILLVVQFHCFIIHYIFIFHYFPLPDFPSFIFSSAYPSACP